MSALAICVTGAVPMRTASAETAKPVDESQAETIAIKACHGGTVKSETTTTTHGVPAYAVEVNVANKSFIERVTVDRQTGAIRGETYAGQQT